MFTYAQFPSEVLVCSCMQFSSGGSTNCSTGVSYTVVAGTGGCCTGTANTATIMTTHMNAQAQITSMDISEAPGDIGQFLCC